MDEKLIKNYQEVVSPGDDVYFLGDFAMRNHLEILRRLPGRKYLLLGNHDYKHRKLLKKGFIWVKDVFQLRCPLPDRPRHSIWLSHYSHQTWPKKHHRTWHLFGHSHGNLPGIGQSTDVGVDSWGYKPVSLKQLIALFKEKEKHDHRRNDSNSATASG